MHAQAEGESVLGGLFPDGVEAALINVGVEPPCPYPAEREAIANAVPVRRREFLAGRACAHAALRAIGQDGRAIERGADREPLWPPGVVGSISHGGGLAGAVVAPTAVAWSVGLDIEALEPPLGEPLERIVLRPGERSPGERGSGAHLPKLTFAIKECVYKCLFPRTRWRLDFHDVEVEIDRPSRCYRAVVDPRFILAGKPLPPLRGRFAEWEGCVLVGLFMASGGPGHGTDTSPHERRQPRACSSASG